LTSAYLAWQDIAKREMSMRGESARQVMREKVGTESINHKSIDIMTLISDIIPHPD
jgi:hypothetical protein